MYREWESTINLDYLKRLNTAQLLDLLEDDKMIRDTIRVNTKLQSLQRSQAILLASNCWLAEQNLIYQPYLTKTKLILAEKHRDLSQLVLSIRRKQRKLETLQQRFNLGVIHLLLKERIEHSLRESKKICHTFIDGQLLTSDFLESLQNAQTLYHKRLIQAEKIQDIIRQTQIYDHLNLLQTPATFTVCGGISHPSLILLPGLHLHHPCVCSCVISNKELDHKQVHCKCKESHKRPQRHFHLQPLEKIYKPKTPK